MKRFDLVAISIFIFGAAVASAAGQAPKPTQTPDSKPSAPTAAASLPEPKPGPQIEKLLRALEGTWSIKETFAPDAASPKGSTGEGMIVWRAGPGGFSVIEDYRSKRANNEVTGLAAFWWDETAHGYRTIWCDSTNPGGCIDFRNVVQWQGSQLVLVEDYEVNGKKLTFKEVFGEIGVNTFTQTLYGGDVGSELKVDQTIQATKLRAAADRGAPRK